MSGRPTEPPEGPEPPMPDGHCWICDKDFKGDKCPTCGRTQEESEADRDEIMETRINEFVRALDQHEVFNFGEQQIEEIWNDGWDIKAIPKFGVSFTAVMEIPGVSEIYIDRNDCGKDDTIVTIQYDPDDAMTDAERAEALEDIQRLCNRQGPTRAARLVGALKRGKSFETWETQTKDKLDCRTALEAGFKYQ